MQKWCARLFMKHVVGREEELVDLFHYTDEQYGVKPSHLSLIRFDSCLYLPDMIGLGKLIIDLKKSALLSGSNLINRNNQFQLCCYQCYLYKDKTQ